MNRRIAEAWMQEQSGDKKCVACGGCHSQTPDSDLTFDQGSDTEVGPFIRLHQYFRCSHCGHRERLRGVFTREQAAYSGIT